MPEEKFEVTNNHFGFRWGPILVERTASNEKNPKWIVLRIFDWRGKIIEIHMRPRSTEVDVEESIKRQPRKKMK